MSLAILIRMDVVYCIKATPAVKIKLKNKFKKMNLVILFHNYLFLKTLDFIRICMNLKITFGQIYTLFDLKIIALASVM